MIDGRHQLVGRGGEGRIDLQLDLRAVFSHRPLVAPPNAREGKDRTLVPPAQSKPSVAGCFAILGLIIVSYLVSVYGGRSARFSPFRHDPPWHRVETRVSILIKLFQPCLSSD
jgi:hypothetical protein